MVYWISSDTNTQPQKKYMWSQGKSPTNYLRGVCHTLFRLSEHPEKTSNNKQILHIIQKNGFRLLLNAAVKNGTAATAEWSILWCTCQTILHSQSSHEHRRVNDFVMMVQKTMIAAKVRDSDFCLQAALELFSCYRAEYTWCCTVERRIGLQYGTGLCRSWADRQSLYNTTRISWRFCSIIK